MHLILPHAASHRWPEAPVPQLGLPHLQQLLGRMRPVQTLKDLEWERPHPLMPHERALALALGWPEAGPWPMAALESDTPGSQAWITPCHWQVGMDQVVMRAPEELQLQDDESQQLLQAMQAYMAEDGLQVRWHSALRWHAQGELLEGLATASLARVSGANIRPWITDGSLPAPLRRLQSEMQMLLYQHPVNDARMARGLPIVNAFWLHGAGHPHATATTPGVRCIGALEDGWRHHDFASWQSAWHALDREVLAPLVNENTPVTLTLCSETCAHTWRTVPLAWHERMLRRIRPVDTAAVLRALLDSPEPT
ncbi:MAG: hypothetical protein ACKOWC_08025 [Limnohabitans sp.]